MTPPIGTLISMAPPDRVTGRLAGRPAQDIAGCPVWTGKALCQPSCARLCCSWEDSIPLVTRPLLLGPGSWGDGDSAL